MKTNQIAPDSRLRMRKEIFVAPMASDDDYIVNAEDISSGAVGDLATLVANQASSVMLPQRDYVKATATDADAGGELVLTIEIRGYFEGDLKSEELTLNSGNSYVATTTQAFDEVDQVKIIAITSPEAGDLLDVGTAGTFLGLREGKITKVADVLLIKHNDNGTFARIAVSSSSVDVDNNGIKGLTLAPEDLYEIEYWDRGSDNLGLGGSSE